MLGSRKSCKVCCFLFAHTVLPLGIGGISYLSWAPPTLRLFSWLDGLGMRHLVYSWRRLVGEWKEFLPPWVLCHLADFLWVYALTMVLALLWLRGTNRLQPVIFGGLFLGFALEWGQAIRLVPGTFDPLDLLFETGGCLLALVNFHRYKKRSDSL